MLYSRFARFANRIRDPASAGPLVDDAHPGGHAKWVQNPHGPATVSGERTLILALSPARHWTARSGKT